MKIRFLFPVILALSIALPACAGGYYSAPYGSQSSYGGGYYQPYTSGYAYGYRPAPVYRSYGRPWHDDHHWNGHGERWHDGDHGHHERWERHERHNHH